MTAITLGSAPSVSGDQKEFNRWVQSAFREIERSSYEDIENVVNDFSITGALTEARSIDLDTATDAQKFAFIFTFIQDLKNRGRTRT